MAYLYGIGDGADPSAIIFNSTKYPGTCKPSDTYTLSAFKELQRQLNRVAQGKGIAKIGVDGDIGPGTINLARAVGVDSSGSCTIIAQNAVVYALVAKGLADQLGVPASVSQPTPIKAPTLVSATTGAEVIAPNSGIAASIGGAFSGLSTLGKLAAVGIIGGLGYVLLVPPKKSRRK